MVVSYEEFVFDLVDICVSLTNTYLKYAILSLRDINGTDMTHISIYPCPQ